MKTMRERLGDPPRRNDVVAARRKAKYHTLIMDAVSDPGLPWMNRMALARYLKLSSCQLYKMFSAEELDKIEDEAMENRRQRLTEIRQGYTPDLLQIDQTVLSKAKKGSLGHATLAYNRFEGPVSNKMEVTGKDGESLFSPEKLLAELLKKEDTQE